MKHIIYALVENKPGVLARISGLFSARGFNIDSLAVGETQDPTMSRVSLVVNAKEERILEQIKKQLNKLVDVISVTDLTKKEFFERELILVKIKTVKITKQKLVNLLKNFTATVLSYDAKAAVIEVVGEQQQIIDLLNCLKPLGIEELVRTGRIAIAP
jgi:acetolactate synthase I/III small subunit